MTDVPPPVFTVCAWCHGALAGNSPMEIWGVGPVRYRTGPIGPQKRRYRVAETAGHRAACGHCAPLVRASDFPPLATRAVVQAAVAGDPTAGTLPHAELVGLFRAVDDALLAPVP
ncbi:hypothetical protein AD006_29635 (plasmid) [Pseudonocardia sp. EC080610-09]|uniref:hypothetical protein n=1 Tax=unclassified Pseudonocardia TaxID=2619320 RepID=UPI000706E718|nr:MULTISPECIES: hypothetical protein [unclassified Pseudonocardia]ALL79429.1 hypothetical protein AD006_29635 [Pseudonocardia sp. EC080610-09]ALL85618.1 hypothetical protein AD017_31615 [Pseudonocardia sp. EC080619-01]